MSQAHTEYVLEHYGFTKALGFHLAVRCYPPASHMQGVCERAIKAVNEGRPEKRIRLNDALTVGRCARVTWEGQVTAPAVEVVRGFRLEAFIEDGEE